MLSIFRYVNIYNYFEHLVIICLIDTNIKHERTSVCKDLVSY
jgi:hypothetical protein